MIDINQELDCSGLSCPMPMLKLGKTMKKMNSGEIIHMIATDPGSKKDVPDWVQKNGHDMIKNEIIDGKFHYYVKKK